MKRKVLIKAICFLHLKWMDSFDSLLVCLRNGREEWKLFISDVVRYGKMEQQLLQKLYRMEDAV